METVLTWTSKGQRSRGDSCSFKHDSEKKEVHPSLLPLKRERTQEVTEKETPKGKDPKVSVRQESQTRRYATNSKARSAENNPHVIVATHQHALTSGAKVVANDGYKCIFTHPGKVGDDRHQRSGNGSMSMKTGRSTGDEMCLERRPRVFFFQYDFF